MRLRLRNIRGTIRSILVLLLVMAQLFLSQPLVFAVIGDYAWVSPGKIPDTLGSGKENDHFLGNSSFRVKLEYPRSFILQETVGDFHFTVNLRSDKTETNWTRVDIYIPPEFQVTTSKSYVWSNITNNYGNIGISKASSSDRIAPSWYRVSVTSETQMKTGNYSVRIFNVTAPSIVGRYFFKVLTNGTSIDPSYFPSVVVSADPNPAYVSGTVRYGGRLSSYTYGIPIARYGEPIALRKGEGGKVYAVGVTAEGRIVIGRAFFNNSANYTLYGLAPGRYLLNATAAGYAPEELPYSISLKAGQSLEGIDIFLEHSPITTVVALSRRMKQPEPWGAERKITLEVFDLWNTTIRLLNSTTNSVITSHQFTYYGEVDWDGHIPQENANYTGGIGPGRYYFRVWVNRYVQPSAANEWVWTNECAVVFTRNEQNRKFEILLEKTGTLWVTVHFANSTLTLSEAETGQDGTLTVEVYDLVEEVRARNSISVPARSRTASVELTGITGGSRDYGLPAGEYIVFARWTLKSTTHTDSLRLYSVGAGYVSIGEVYLPSAYRYGPTGHRVTVGDGLNNVSFWVVLQGGLNVTVLPVTWQKPYSVNAWKYNGSSITVEIRDRYGVEVYGSFRLLQMNATSDGRWVPVNNNATVIGLDDGMYSIYVFTYGYVQRQTVFFSVRRGECADISVRILPGIEIDVTVVFEKQRIISPIDTYKYWNSTHHVPIRFEVYDSKAQFVGADATYVPNADLTKKLTVTLAGFKNYRGSYAMRWANYYDTTDGSSQRDYGLEPDLYTIKVYVPGYHQPIEPTVDARAAGNMTVSAILALHRMGRLYGMVHTFNTYYENYTRISWVSVNAIGEEIAVWTSALDGNYTLWLVPGPYIVMYSLPEYETKALRIHIPDGSDVRIDLQLLPFGISPRPSISLLHPWASIPLMPTVSSKEKSKDDHIAFLKRVWHWPTK